MKSNAPATGNRVAKPCPRVRATRKNTASIASRSANSTYGRGRTRTTGAGGSNPRAVVVTVTVAYWPGPGLIADGETEQRVPVAGREHDRFTCAEKPPVLVKEMT